MKEKAYYLHYSDNAHCWNRILMLFNLYWPGMKRSFIFAVLFPVLIYLGAAIVQRYEGRSLEGFLQLTIDILVCIGPITLTQRDYRDISAQLPVTTFEKLGFLLIAFWIIWSVMINVSLHLGQLLSGALFAVKFPIEIFSLKEIGFVVVNSIPFLPTFIIIGAFVTVELYYIVKARTNRPLKAWICFWTVWLSMILTGGIFNIFGWYSAKLGFTDQESQSFSLHAFFIICALIMCVYTIKLYKLLRHSGF